MAFCCCPKCSRTPIIPYLHPVLICSFFPLDFYQLFFFFLPWRKPDCWNLLLFHYYFYMRHNTNTHRLWFSPGGPDCLWSWVGVSGVIFNQPFLELLRSLKVIPRSGGRVWTGAFKGKATVRLSFNTTHTDRMQESVTVHPLNAWCGISESNRP